MAEGIESAELLFVSARNGLDGSRGIYIAGADVLLFPDVMVDDL